MPDQTNIKNNDLWPDDIISQSTTITPPVAILREQAAALGRRTNNAIRGEVTKYPIPSRGYNFVYSFHITAPGIDYKYQLFRLSHNIDFYPLIIDGDDEVLKDIIDIKKQSGIKVSSEDHLKSVLRDIFSSAKTRRVLLSLLSLAGYDKQENDLPF